MQSLPKGLVTTSPRIPSHLTKDPGKNLVDAGDIALLWKVYHSNSAIHDNDAGHRLENFFWRLWGNERLLKSLQGATLARLFCGIAEAKGQVKLTSSVLRVEKMATDSGSLVSKDLDKKNGGVLPKQLEGDTLETPSTYSSNSNSKNGYNSPTLPLPPHLHPHPILKKPNSTQNGETSQKKTRLLLTGLRGQNTRKPSHPLPSISPPPFAVSGAGAGGGGGCGDGEAGIRQHQRRPHFVASKAGKRRPVLVRRKSSQTAVPSLLRSEVRVDSLEDAKGRHGDGLDEGQALRPNPKKEHQVKGFEAEKVPEILVTSEIQPDSEDLYTKSPNEPPPEDPALNTKPQVPPDFVSNLKYLFNHKPTKTTKTRSRYNFPCGSIYRHGDYLKHLKPKPYMHPPPTKLVDDHFRVRFAEELQREETLLKAMNSLPESGRKAILERHTRALGGQPEPPTRPRTTWVVVPDDEAEAEGDSCSPQTEDSADVPPDSEDWSPSHGEEAGEWTADDVQDYTDRDLDAVAFRFEGMSYTSSSRAASRLRAPGQLTVLFRSEQYEFPGPGGGRIDN